MLGDSGEEKREQEGGDNGRGLFTPSRARAGGSLGGALGESKVGGLPGGAGEMLYNDDNKPVFGGDKGILVPNSPSSRRKATSVTLSTGLKESGNRHEYGYIGKRRPATQVSFSFCSRKNSSEPKRKKKSGERFTSK